MFFILELVSPVDVKIAVITTMQVMLVISKHTNIASYPHPY